MKSIVAEKGLSKSLVVALSCASMLFISAVALGAGERTVRPTTTQPSEVDIERVPVSPAEPKPTEGISQRSLDWFKSNTFHHGRFADIGRLIRLKKEQGLTISVVLPALNEATPVDIPGEGRQIITVQEVVRSIRQHLVDEKPLVDELILIDSGSTDGTREIAEKEGATVYLAKDILPGQGDIPGKGENLWKALFIAKGKIIVYIDTDIKNIHPRFVYGLVGPLLERPDIQYVKAFYQRPQTEPNSAKVVSMQGGRVTEIRSRVEFSLWWPELSLFVQPLSGEYAGRRELLEQLSYPVGYGIETAHLLDIYDEWGLTPLAQTDLELRVHRNQLLKSLGNMSFGIQQSILNRLQKQGKLKLREQPNLTHTSFVYDQASGTYTPEFKEIVEKERPPMIRVREYREKFGRKLFNEPPCLGPLGGLE